MQTTTPTTKATKQAIVAAPQNVPATLAPTNLLATLKAQAPATATSAQLATAIGAVQGAYVAVQNGIAAPTRGTSCIMVWCAFCNYCVTHQTAPTLVQLAPSLTSVNPTTQSVQYYKVRKYFGL
jgi:hypothetical protein